MYIKLFCNLILIYMKKYVLLIGWKQVHILMWHGCKVEIWVQITNSAYLSKFCLSWLEVMFLCLHYKQLIKWFLLQFGANLSNWNFFKDYNGLIQFCCVWKIYQCLLTPNCKRNHVTTFTNDMEIFCNWGAFSREKSVLTLIKVW